jgi:hypothetical protein
MSEQLRVWMEVIFNITYLVVVWTLVILMIVRRNRVDPENRALAYRFTWAFTLLALGDSGHVGFRVIAYLMGGLEANSVLVGAGAFSTAFTVTIFYMLMVDIWHLRFKKPLGFFGWFLLTAGIARLVILLFPQNAWGQVVAPYDWSLLRNSLLVIQGVGVTVLILRDAIRAHDKPFIWIGTMIVLSFAFYAPVILWVQWVPLLGMLMIPKTCAYLVVAFIAYFELFRPKKSNPLNPADKISE